MSAREVARVLGTGGWVRVSRTNTFETDRFPHVEVHAFEEGYEGQEDRSTVVTLHAGDARVLAYALLLAAERQ